jgi:outer membrane receptor protein involved in Fe transport
MNPFLPSLLAALVTTTQVAYAIETGGISGYVTDEVGLPIPGAEVRLSGVDLAGEKMVVANDDGEFVLDGLSPGTYQLGVYFKGALIAKAEVRVALNTTTKVPIEARLGAVSEEIEIVGFKPVVDTSSSAISNELSAKEIQEIPVGRSYQDVIQTMAGVSGRIDTSSGGGGDGNPSVRGEGQYGNNYTIDGVSTRDPATKTFGQNVNFDAIESIQVFTDGAPAEFGQFTGMMVNVVTKDGGDEHHGSVAMFYSQHAFFENRYPIFKPERLKEVPTIKSRFWVPVMNATAGGPIVPEKLWYFTALDLDYSKSIPEGLPAGKDGENAIDVYGGQFMGKLTFFANRSWTLRYIFNGDYARQARYDASQFVLPEATSDRVDFGQNHRLTATLAPDDKNTLELRFGYLNSNLDIVPTSGDLETASRLDAQGVLHDNAQQKDLNDRNRVGGGFMYTRFIDQLLGTHKVKAGAEYWLLVSNREIVNTGTDRVQWIDGSGNPVPGDQRDVGTRWAPYDDVLTPEFEYPCTQGDYSDCGIREHWVNAGKIGNKVDTFQAFLQDDWRPIKQLTVNAGVRLDYEQGYGNDGKKPPTQSPTEFTKPVGQRQKGEYGPVLMPAPRFGFALDPWNDGKTKIAGHYGQYYDIAGAGLWEWANSRSANSFVRFVRDPGTGDFGWSNTQDATGAPLIYADSLKPAVMNKVNLGFEREVAKDFSVGLRGILSATSGIPEDVDVNLNDWYIMNVPIKRRYYRAVELTARKQFDEVWQLWGAYTLSESYGNTPGQFELAPGAESGSDGNNVGVYLDDIGDRQTREDFVNGGLGWILDGLAGLGRYSVTEPQFYDEAGWYGYMPYHSFHMVKLNGSYTAPFGTSFGLVYEFDSGHAWEKRTLVPFYGYDAFGQGRGGRMMPAVHYVDGRVSHEVKWGKSQSLEGYLDVFNIPGFMAAITYYSVDAPGFGSTLYRQAPRSVRLGLKYRY